MINYLLFTFLYFIKSKHFAVFIRIRIHHSLNLKYCFSVTISFRIFNKLIPLFYMKDIIVKRAALYL